MILEEKLAVVKQTDGKRIHLPSHKLFHASQRWTGTNESWTSLFSSRKAETLQQTRGDKRREAWASKVLILFIHVSRPFSLKSMKQFNGLLLDRSVTIPRYSLNKDEGAQDCFSVNTLQSKFCRMTQKTWPELNHTIPFISTREATLRLIYNKF